MRAIILVGGFGTRLRPLTENTPKQMLPVVDRPMIERVVTHLGRHGVTQAVLSLGYRPDAFLDAYPNGTCAGVSLTYAVEPEPLDTAGAVRFAALHADINERFIVVNGDVLTDVDIGALWNLHGDLGAEGTIVLTPVDDPSRYGVVPIDSTGKVEAFIEKPPPGEAPSHWINAGTYVLEPSVIDRIPDGVRASIERETFPAMVADGSLYGHHSDAYWVDAGTPATYLQAQLDLIDGVRGLAEAAVAADAELSDSATLDRAIVMRRVTVSPDAIVRGSALLPGAVIGAGATVIDSIIGPRSVVGDRATVSGLSVVGDRVRIEAGSHLVGAKVPQPG
jgi:mannose-1-phosphate guanylyltransferase